MPTSARSRLPAIGHRERRVRAFRSGRAWVSPTPTDRPAAAAQGRHPVVLEVKDLRTYFFTYEGVVRALDGINLKVRGGETTGIVGETGCGKSVTAFSVTRLIGDPGRVVGGEVRFQGANLLWDLEREAKYRRVKGSDRIKVIRRFRRIRAANERLAALRGRRIAMIFQEPMAAMNPVFSISNQLGEAVLTHQCDTIVEDLLAADRNLRRMVAGPRFEDREPSEPGRRDEVSDLALELTSRAEPPGPPDQASEPPTNHGSGTPVDILVSAAGRSSDELRVAAERFAKTFGLASLATQLFYPLKNVNPGFDARPRVLRALRRVELNGRARAYFRYRRGLAAFQRRLNEVYLKEMTSGKPHRTERSRVHGRITLWKLRHLYLSIPGFTRSGRRALDQEVFWRTVRMLEGVRIANPVGVAKSYPHELSGGMLQRVMIAMALSCNPDLLLADEPTTALDVTIQAQVLELMRHLKEEVGTAIVLITHDLGVIAEVCDLVNVMYAGRIIESAGASELFRRPLHPYTQGLLASIPRFDQPGKELQSIPGSVPGLIHPPPGCRFHPRCPYAMKVCKELRPAETQLGEAGEEHMVACHLYETHEEATLPETAETPVAPESVESAPAPPVPA